MKVLLVGEDNPHSADPRRALAPLPRGAAGDRLRRVLGMTVKEYLRAFYRVNLCRGRWDRLEAEQTARFIKAYFMGTGDHAVLLGRKVCGAFKVKYAPFCVVARVTGMAGTEAVALALPHPSGRCRTWNDPAAADRAKRAVRHVLRLAGSVV